MFTLHKPHAPNAITHSLALQACPFHSGTNVSKAGDGVLQTLWGEFDSHRLQIIAFVPQLVQEEPCKFLFVSSTLTEGCDLITQQAEYTPFKRRRVGSNPTEVTIRLIAQWKERLASNEKVLGSNPSKAVNPSLAQRTEHSATDAGCRRFESCMGVQLPLAQLVAQVPYKNEVERSSRSRKTKCPVAQRQSTPLLTEMMQVQILPEQIRIAPSTVHKKRRSERGR
jgi:hypothetical protein